MTYGKAAGLAYEYEAAWIMLRVRSAVGAVDLTASVSAALAGAGFLARSSPHIPRPWLTTHG